MSDKELPKRWQKESRAIKAIQVAFDVGEKAQKQIRKEAVELNINPSDRVRRLLGLPVTSKPIRPRLSISLSEQDFSQLAKDFALEDGDRVKIKQRAAQLIIEHTQKSGK